MTASDEPMSDAAADLVALVASCTLYAVQQLGCSSALAPELGQRLALADAIDGEVTRGRTARTLLGDAAPSALHAYQAPLESFLRGCPIRDWGEAMTHLWLVAGLCDDLVTKCAHTVPASLRDLLAPSLGGLSQWAGDQVRAVLSSEPTRSGRLAMFGRRVMGETLGLVERVAGSHPELTGLLTGVPAESEDLSALTALISTLIERHAARMGQLGLQA